MNINQLKKYCLADKKELLGGGRYRFIDNGSDVLAVAHVDTVADFSKDRTHNFEVHGDVVTSIALDDRLGLWIIMEVLPLFGVVPDVLITDDEEIGQSTAQFFEPDKQYNWMFSFDRGGNDVVMYQYDNEESWTQLEEFGFKVGHGSFSDISFMGHLGCIGFNFGTEYHKAHTRQCNAKISNVITQVELFALFYDFYKDTPMPYAHQPYNKKYNYGDWEWGMDVDIKCAYCRERLTYENVGEYNSDVCVLREDALLDIEWMDDLDDYHYQKQDWWKK